MAQITIQQAIQPLAINFCQSTRIQTLIAIPEGYRVKGSVIAEQVRTLDLRERWWQDTGEILAAQFVDRVVALLQLIIN